MNLADFLENINKIVEKDPEVLKLDVIYSKDDEGNQFNYIVFTPTICVYNQENKTMDDTPNNPNAICIN